jgi:ATP-dependent DNA helicase Q4
MNGYDRLTIKKIVMKMFDVCECKESSCNDTAVKFKHNVGLPIQEMVDFLDIKEESILTLLCYLEAAGYVQIRSNCFKTCTIQSYKGALYLSDLAKKNDLAAVLMKLKLRYDQNNTSNEFTVDVMEICEELSGDFENIRQRLRQLEWEGSDSFRHKSGLSVQFSTQAFYVKRMCICVEEDLDEINDYLWKRVYCRRFFLTGDN